METYDVQEQTVKLSRLTARKIDRMPAEPAVPGNTAGERQGGDMTWL